MTIKVDAKGMACPLPVIETKKALESISEGIVEVTVDDVAPKENILKFAKSVKAVAEVIKDTDDEKIIRITKGESTKIDIADEDIKCDISTSNEVVLIKSNKMGSGNDELGEVLIKGFLFALSEATPLPSTIMLINGGVELSAKNEATIEHLKRMEDSGVEILSCGTCLEYYGLKENLQVGSITNMYTIVETMKSASKLITI
ncbi:sulfurtransferase-like selenium metabolism protein YedF [Peptostreptococcus faecalis]|uniref:sulfurtransferase-like selenium metabolism protein YedF n=1 Tax=Peptostreptococcus faecalis TaxID=2045015 RepID=UPI000C7CC597|nr:sulfurtransferase-like selenium metabolism protein YedF [Peptostreptococcus faecalis]